jgi:lambda family phage portal protein
MAGHELREGIIGHGRDPAYRAAAKRGTFSNWLPTNAGPSTVIEADSQLISARARDSYRNSGFIKKIIHTLATSEVGDGIKTHSTAKSKRYRKEIMRLWDQWIFECDADGVLTYDGLVNLSVVSRYMVGGMFMRMIPVSKSNGLIVPLVLKCMEIDQVPIEMSKEISRGRIVQGIEFNRSGRKVAVHAFKNHPSDHINIAGITADVRTARIPIEDMIHHYEPIRAGQVREIPWIVEAIEVSKRIDQYTHSELTRKHIKSMITGFITREQFTEDDMLFDPFTGKDLESGFVPGNIKMNPGMLGTLNPGEKIVLTDADAQADGYDQYMRFHVQQMASAVYVPYELVSGDYSQINDRLVRSILDDYRRFINARQQLVTIPQICKRIWEKFNDVAVISGAISAPGYFDNRADFTSASYVVQRTPYHHPVQDRQGIRLDMQMGLTTQEIELQKLRRDPDAINAKLDEEAEIANARMPIEETQDNGELDDEV